MRLLSRVGVVVALTIVVAAMGFLSAGSAGADDFLCDGTFGAVNIADNVTVPFGATCFLDGTTVQGNIEVEEGGSLITLGGTTIGGNVEVEENGAFVAVEDTTILGNMESEEGGSLFILGETVLGGNVKVEEDGSLLALGVRIGGNMEADGAAFVGLFQDLGGALTDVEGNVKIEETQSSVICETKIGGNLKAKENEGPVIIGDGCNVGNAVVGNVKAKENEGGVFISNNEIGGNLKCEDNDPVATGVAGSNIVGGKKKGECAGL